MQKESEYNIFPAFENERKKIIIWHFSDLHFGDFSIETEKKFSSEFSSFFTVFQDYLEYQIKTQKPTLIVLSGDIGSIGIFPDTGISKSYLDKFLKIFVDESIPILFCNGNHDLQRQKISSQSQFDEFIKNILAMQHMFGCVFSQSFSKNLSCYVFLEDVNFLFLSLNTCQDIEEISVRKTSKGMSIMDERMLNRATFPAAQFKEILKEIQEVQGLSSEFFEHVKIFLVIHHPFASLENPATFKKILVNNNVQAIFSGHVHHFKYDREFNNFTVGSLMVKDGERKRAYTFSSDMLQFNEYHLDLTSQIPKKCYIHKLEDEWKREEKPFVRQNLHINLDLPQNQPNLVEQKQLLASFKNELESFHFTQKDIFHEISLFQKKISLLKNKFRSKVQNILLTKLFDDYKANFFKFPNYCNREEDFCKLKKKIQDSKCVMITGIGGVGKTAFCDLFLYVYNLLVKEIIYIGSTEVYALGTGYTYGIQNFKKNRFSEISLNKIINTIDSIDGTNLSQNLNKISTEKKCEIILQRLNLETGTLLFLDNYISKDIKQLLKLGNSALSNGRILFTCKEILELTHIKLNLENIKETEKRLELIDIFQRFSDNRNLDLSEQNKLKIADISGGHPIITSLIVSNLETLDLNKISSFRETLDGLSNESITQEFIKRVISDVLDDQSYEMVLDLAQIEEKIEKDMMIQAISSSYTITEKKAKKRIDELIKTFLIKNKYYNGNKTLLIWQYNQIREALLSDFQNHQNLAIKYYNIKIRKSNNLEDEMYLLYHIVKKGEIDEISNKFENFYNKYEDRKKIPQVFFNLGEYFIKRCEIKEEGKIKLNLGRAYLLSSQTEKAQKLFNQSFEIFKKLGDFQGMARNLGNMGLIYKKNKQIEKAMESHQRSYDISKKIGYLKGMASNLANIGLIYMDIGKLEKAMEFYKRSYNIFEKFGGLKGMATNLGNIGLIHKDFGQPKKALEFHMRSYDIFEKFGDLKGMASVLANMGWIYINIGQPEKAMEFYKRSYDIFEKFEDLKGMAQNLGNRGLIHKNIGQHEKAMEYFKQAYDIFEKLGDQQGMAQNLGNMGLSYLINEQPEKALECFKQVYDIFEKIGDLQRITNVLADIGLIYKNLNQPKKALEYFKQAYNILEKLKHPYKEFFRKEIDKIKSGKY